MGSDYRKRRRKQIAGKLNQKLHHINFVKFQATFVFSFFCLILTQFENNAFKVLNNSRFVQLIEISTVQVHKFLSKRPIYIIKIELKRIVDIFTGSSLWFFN